MGIRRLSRLGHCFLPLFLLIFACVVQPAYELPFMQSAVGIVGILITLGWTAAGLYIFTHPFTHIAFKILWHICFFPVVLISLLGPACMTIISALGPMVK